MYPWSTGFQIKLPRPLQQNATTNGAETTGQAHANK